MRPTSNKHRILANSLPEIVNGLEDLAITLKREGIRGPFRAIADGTIHNAISCWLLGQPVERRLQLLRIGVEMFNAAVASDVPVDFEALLGAHKPEYTGLPARRITNKKPSGSNHATG